MLSGFFREVLVLLTKQGRRSLFLSLLPAIVCACTSIVNREIFCSRLLLR